MQFVIILSDRSVHEFGHFAKSGILVRENSRSDGTKILPILVKMEQLIPFAFYLLGGCVRLAGEDNRD